MTTAPLAAMRADYSKGHDSSAAVYNMRLKILSRMFPLRVCAALSITCIPCARVLQIDPFARLMQHALCPDTGIHGALAGTAFTTTATSAEYLLCPKPYPKL